MAPGFSAYNALDARWFVEPDLAQRRAASGVYFVPAAGAPLLPMLLYRGNEQVANADIRALALSGQTLWVGTSAGLFKAEQPTTPNARLQLVTSPNSPQVPIRQVKSHPGSGELWLLADAQEDVPVRLIGYYAARGASIILGPDQGIPAGLPLHDFTFTATDELVVLAGAQMVKGMMRVSAPGWTILSILPLLVLLVGATSGIWFVFYHLLVRELRAQPQALLQFPWPAMAVAFRLGQRAHARTRYTNAWHGRPSAWQCSGPWSPGMYCPPRRHSWACPRLHRNRVTTSIQDSATCRCSCRIRKCCNSTPCSALRSIPSACLRTPNRIVGWVFSILSTL